MSRPGDPDASDLYEVITETDEDKRMPPASSGYQALDVAEISLIKTWIEQGARNLTCAEAIDTSGNDTVVIPSFMTEVAPIIQAKCANQGCHTANNDPRVPLTTYAEVKIAIGTFSMKSRIINGSMPARRCIDSSRIQCAYRLDRGRSSKQLEYMKNFNFKLSFVTCITLSVMLLNACYYDNAEDLYPAVDCAETVSFAAEVDSIISTNCALSGVPCEWNAPGASDRSRPYTSCGK